MPTRRKTLAGGAGLLALLGGVMLFDDENGSDRDPDDGENVEAEFEPEPESEPKPESDSGSETDDGDARLATTVTFPDEDQWVGETVDFGITVENVGNTSGEYTVELELDRVDPDTDFGSNTWNLSGQLDPADVETHVAEHTYLAAGTYELRLDGELVKEFDVSSNGSSRSTGTGSQSPHRSDDEEHSDDALTVEVGGQAAVNATEESPSQYGSE